MFFKIWLAVPQSMSSRHDGDGLGCKEQHVFDSHARHRFMFKQPIVPLGRLFDISLFTERQLSFASTRSASTWPSQAGRHTCSFQSTLLAFSSDSCVNVDHVNAGYVSHQGSTLAVGNLTSVALFQVSASSLSSFLASPS